MLVGKTSLAILVWCSDDGHLNILQAHQIFLVECQISIVFSFFYVVKILFSKYLHLISIEHYLISLDFQLTFLIELSVPEPDPTELKIASKHLLIIASETPVIMFVNHLGNAYHVTIEILDRHTQQGSGLVASPGVYLLVESVILEYKEETIQ